MNISEATRRDIFDEIRLEGVKWSGRLEEPEFLGRIFDLQHLPSHDGRFSDAFDDIWQHRVNNYDWEDDWVFSDPRFNMLRTDDEMFLRFLCEMLHPVVRSDPEEIEKLKKLFNDLLRRDGYEVVERARISGKPVFAARICLFAGASTLQSIRKAFDGADTNYVLQQITRMETAINEDPDLAIGTAKELIETCCKTILKERGVDVQGNYDCSQLVKKTARELALTPENIPDESKAVEIIRRLLSNLVTITQGIAELRNHYGTGHGKAANMRGLQSRHAKLAVGAASTLAVFLLETHQEKVKFKNVTNRD
jgi:hypothetical protein